MSNPFAPPGDEQTRPAPPEGESEPIPQSARGFDRPVSAQPPQESPQGGEQPHGSHQPSSAPGTDPSRRGQQRPRPDGRIGGPGGPGRPNGSSGLGPTRPVRRPPTPEDIAAFKATQRPVLLFVAILVLSILATGLPLPWGIAGLVFLLAALVAGVRAFVVVMRSRRGGMMLPIIGMLIAFALALGAQTIFPIITWQATVNYQECVALAITVEAKDACVAEYKTARQEYMDQHFPGLMNAPTP